MRTPQQKIIDFMKMKVSFFPKPFNKEFFTQADQEAIEQTPTGLCEGFIKNISYCQEYLNDYTICPFCFFAFKAKVRLYEDKCKVCMFAEAHGETCELGVSVYARLLRILKEDSIIDYLFHRNYLPQLLKTLED